MGLTAGAQMDDEQTKAKEEKHNCWDFDNETEENERRIARAPWGCGDSQAETIQGNCRPEEPGGCPNEPGPGPRAELESDRKQCGEENHRPHNELGNASVDRRSVPARDVRVIRVILLERSDREVSHRSKQPAQYRETGRDPYDDVPASPSGCCRRRARAIHPAQDSESNSGDKNNFSEEAHNKAHDFDKGADAAERVSNPRRRSTTVQRDGDPRQPCGYPDHAAADPRVHVASDRDERGKENQSPHDECR
jgi:hypothetical protein